MKREKAEEIEDAAAVWVAMMDGGRWDDAALAHWLAGDPRRAGALLQAQAAWLSLDDARPEAVASRRPLIGRAMTRRSLVVAGGALAASIAGAALFLPRGRTFATGLGEVRRLPLPDGSLAAINTSSALEVDTTPALRRIVLTQGEAWFQVAKDAQRPFVVEAGGVHVRAVGTAFSVRRHEAGADVYVTEGIVEVTTRDGGVRRPMTAGAGVFFSDDATAQPLASDSASVDRVLAWRSGDIALDGRPLASAVAEFNRYNRRQIVIRDAALLDERLDGTFRTNNPVEFAQAVHDTLNVPVDLSDPSQIEIGR